MRNLCLALLVGGLVAFTGCNTGTPGGPGATNKDKTLGQKDNTFNIVMPTGGVTIKQGEEKPVEFDIKRGKDFDQDVTLKFDGLPTGVSADPKEPEIKHGEAKTKVTFKGAADATLGKHTVTVKGHPAKSGPDSEGKFDLTVTEKK
jgi:hypothetical protein